MSWLMIILGDLETKNQCFNLTISEKDMVGLAFNDLRSYL
jgi:hypothetical protein